MLMCRRDCPHDSFSSRLNCSANDTLLVNVLLRGTMSIFLERKVAAGPPLTVVPLENSKNSVLTIEISVYLILCSLSLLTTSVGLMSGFFGDYNHQINK